MHPLSRDDLLLSSEQLFLDMGKKLVELGFKDLGYEFVNIDVSDGSLKGFTRTSYSSSLLRIVGCLKRGTVTIGCNLTRTDFPVESSP